MRCIALDVHRDFCEVAIAEAGEVRLVGRVKTEPEALELFARSLAATDRVALEATGNALAITRIIEPHVDRVLLANPKAVKGATQTAKTDKVDELALVDKSLAQHALASPEMKRLMTLPGVSFVTAAALMAAIGDISRFPTPRHLVAYLGLNPRVRQSGSEPARHGRISKQGPGEARHLLVEAAWHAARTTGPLRAFAERIKRKRGANIATVAVARKLVVIAWHMLGRGEDYAITRPSLVREKLRKLELAIGAERRKGKRNPLRVFATPAQHRLEKQLAAQAEIAYRRLLQDWQPAIKKGAGAAPGRATRGPSSGQAARQDT